MVFYVFLSNRVRNDIKELTSKLTQEELIHWVAFFELKKEMKKSSEDSKINHEQETLKAVH